MIENENIPQQENSQENNLSDPLDGLFDQKIPTKTEKEEEKVPVKKEEVSEEESNETKNEPQDKESEEAKEVDFEEERKSFSKEISTLRKRLGDSQKYGNINAEKVKQASNQIMHFIESGDISEEEGQQILSILSQDKVAVPNSDAVESSNPFQKFFNVVTNDVVQAYLDVTEDNDFRKKVDAFDAYLSESSQEELDYLHSELLKVGDKPLALLKKMLAVGENTLKDGYDDLFQSGGFRKYAASQKEKIKSLQDEVDKLKKKLIKYQNEGKPTHGIQELTDFDNPADKSEDPLDGLFAAKVPSRR